jgi:hypothetical protein
MMTNIKIPIVIAITVIAASYWLSNNASLDSKNNEDSHKASTQSESVLPAAIDNVSKKAKVEQLLTVAKAEKASQAKRFLPKKATPILLSKQELSIIKEKSQLKQAEINLLIAQYGENISDKDKTEDLQAKVKILMAEYNELILPLALNSMAERNNG